MKRKISLFITILLLGFCGQTLAGGSDFLPVFGARTLSLNGLNLAGSNGLSSSFFNPAGLSFLNSKGIEFVAIDRLEQQVFDSRRHGLYNSFRDDNTGFGGGIFWKLSESITTSLAYTRVVDYNVNWPYAMVRRSDSLSALLAFDMKNNIHVDAIAPSVSMNIGPMTLGLAFDVYRVQAFSAFPIVNSLWYTKGKGAAAYQLEYDQKAWAFGATLGALTDLSEKIRLGAFIKSGYKANLEGTARSNIFSAIDSTTSEASIKSKIESPLSFGMGIVYKMADDLSLNVDAVFNLWGSTQKTMDITFNNQLWQNRLSRVDSLSGITPGSINLQYRNSIDAGFGLEYTSSSGMQYRVGYRYSQSPNSDDTFSFLFPSVDKHWISAGFGYTDENLTFDASVAYSFGLAKEINKTGNYSNLSGKYSSDNWVPTISLQYRF